MKFSFLACAAHLAALGLAANQDDVDFLTALVSDYDENKKQYVDFIRTANDVPADLIRLATQVVTYTDDLYTTLLDGDDVNVSSLKAFATELPWYSRLAAEAAVGAESGSAESASTTSAAASSSASSSDSGAAGMLAPAGALLGGIALLML